MVSSCLAIMVRANRRIKRVTFHYMAAGACRLLSTTEFSESFAEPALRNPRKSVKLFPHCATWASEFLLACSPFLGELHEGERLEEFVGEGGEFLGDAEDQRVLGLWPERVVPAP